MGPINMLELPNLSLDVTPEVVLAYAHLTDDFNPIHLDQAFAVATPMKGVIAHGTLSFGLIWQALDLARLPNSDGMLWKVDVRFVLPVRLGDRVTAGGQSTGVGIFNVWVKNGHGEVVIAGTATRTPR
jgi:3-hydroxybutyryl-CoA dehydratase